MKLDDLSAADAMQPRAFDRSGDALEKGSRGHDPLNDAIGAEPLADMEMPASVVELWRLLNERRNVNVIERHTQLSLPVATRHEPGIGRLFGALINCPVNGQELTTRINAGRSA